ncbi:response regulator [Sporosarcina sp. PTS2304]|uniref:ATP-binding protein n=1 Tax=Sporosarcina sp. PTS2304 TaxID=2283194 RepID=UPI000E0D15C7|nr:ATP-binding protein [Sporosarcina sp. PTS2304]AXI00801.1 response regulator [Sporosarcina sp. PTS2304]
MDKRMLSKKKIVLTVSLFIAALTIVRVCWLNYFEAPEHIKVEKGFLDLSDWNITDKQTFSLDGDWEFYPGQFIQPSTIDEWKQQSNKKFIQVPSDWTDVLSSDEQQSVYGYGTYRLRLLLPADAHSLYGLRFKEVNSAATVYVNGKQVVSYNNPNQLGEVGATQRGPFYGLFPYTEQHLDIIVHVSNYDSFRQGGIAQSVVIGSGQGIIKESDQSITLQLVVGIIYFLHSIYAFFIYYTNKKVKQKAFFFYGLLLLSTAFTILLDDDVVIQLPVSFHISHHLLWIGFMSNLLLMPIIITYLFTIKSTFIRYLIGFYIALVGVFIIIPYEKTLYIMVFVAIFYLFSLLFLLYHTNRVLKKGYDEAIFILLWIASYTSNIAWGVAIQSGGINIPYYPFDYLVSLVVIVVLLFKQHQKVVLLNEQQAAKLQAADQQKDVFLANTSHELRNPLHGIITIAQTLLQDRDDKLLKENRHSLELLVSVGQRMTLLLNDLLDVKRLKEGIIRLDRKSVRIQGVALGVLDLMRYVIDGKNIKLQMNIADDFPAVYADENRLVQILFNLIENATKFTNEGTIAVDASIQKGLASVSVTDTGIGLKAEMINTLFEPYGQLHEHTVSNGGIGLGLVICKELVELHGGLISAASTRGKGTTFTFTLPLANGKEHTEPERSEVLFVHTDEKIQLQEQLQTCNANKNRILLVDDDPVNLRVVCALLESKYVVTTAMSGKEALEQVRTHEWDLVISDVMMPVMSGYELSQHIRKLYTISELPILLLTARSQPQDIFMGFQAGTNDYVSKPVDAIELQARVEGLIELKQSVHEQLRLEAAWLQAQIQPHFLFNTLNTIAALAEIDPKRMLKLLEEFASYLQKSFNVLNTSSLVPLENELQLTRSYVYIEQERFGDRLQVEWDIDTEAIDVPPLSLQPLVENAIRHGVLKRIEGGTVCVRVKQYAQYVELSIIDNGVGMAREKVDALLSDQLSSEERGIGISNTNRRCKQLFGKGLSIVSEEGRGTTISFQIPLQLKKSD